MAAACNWNNFSALSVNVVIILYGVYWILRNTYMLICSHPWNNVHRSSLFQLVNQSVIHIWSNPNKHSPLKSKLQKLLHVASSAHPAAFHMPVLVKYQSYF
ncbi:hypothetical protein KSS87_006053 [Heliosperma pusillum]|nr:hypothetical protein KSS87_006053 [Heliosperma pusillum]